jgi:hypothetical protein
MKISHLNLFMIFVISMISCTGIKTTTSGLENNSFLEFVGSPNQYKGGVTVTIDEKNTFIAEVKKANSALPKGTTYAINSGSHQIVVTFNNKKLYQKQIFVGTQETKKIELP